MHINIVHRTIKEAFSASLPSHLTGLMPTHFPPPLREPAEMHGSDMVPETTILWQMSIVIKYPCYQISLCTSKLVGEKVVAQSVRIRHMLKPPQLKSTI